MNDGNNSKMEPLLSKLDSLLEKGYKEDYKVSKSGLKALKTGKIYPADEVTVIDFYRFDDKTYSNDETIMYVIETKDGGKGTLIDAFGNQSAPLVIRFMKKVEEISEKK